LGNQKIKIMMAILELPHKQQCQSSPFTSKIGPNIEFLAKWAEWAVQFSW
jgi:hypothetical protein